MSHGFINILLSIEWMIWMTSIRTSMDDLDDLDHEIRVSLPNIHASSSIRRFQYHAFRSSMTLLNGNYRTDINSHVIAWMVD